MLLFLFLIATAYAEVDYETCTKKNDYFESVLPELPKPDIETSCPPDNISTVPKVDMERFINELRLPAVCVRESMQNAPRQGHYGHCIKKAGELKFTGIERPCFS